MIKTLRIVGAVCAIAWGTVLLAQTASLTYPSPRKGDVVDPYFGMTIADPYRWMEDLNAPDAQHFAYGQSEGGSDWSTYYVRELATGQQLPDVIRWVKFSGLAWTEDGKGFFYGRYPEPRAGKALEDAVRDKKIYYHALGTEQSADRLIYERPEEPMLFIDADRDETGRYVFFF